MAAVTHPAGFPATAQVLAGLGKPACCPGSASTTFGTLGNFYVLNDSGDDCHGFGIELEGLQATDVLRILRCSVGQEVLLDCVV